MEAFPSFILDSTRLSAKGCNVSILNHAQRAVAELLADQLVCLNACLRADVHELVFGAYPQAAYTLQLHGALSAVVADAPGQTTNFTYLNHTSRNANSHRIEVFRPAGAGCTRSAFINYSPFATSDDGTCAAGAFLRVDSASASSGGTGQNASDLLDWYEFGVVNALQPLLLGGQAVLTPVLFTAANATAQQMRR